jgi:TPP-dependent pyruvate/acetoin dehydrogenase alpha subunit
MATIQALEKSLLLEMLRRMVRIRRFEEQVVRLVERGEIVGAPTPTSGRKRLPWEPVSPCARTTI